MKRVKFGDVVKEIKISIDRDTDDHEYYVAGEHMETENLRIASRGRFDEGYVGPAFIRLFKPGQVLYGSRRTYLKKVAVADFEGITSNTTFVLETKDENVFLQRLLPFVMLTDEFTKFSIKKSRGSTNPYVLFSDMAEYEFNLPDISTQKELTEILWAAYDTKTAYQELLKQTDELVKSQFIELFGDDEIGKCTWPVEKMEDVFSISSSRRILKSEWKSEGNIPFIRVRDMVQLANGEPLTNEFYVSEEFYNSRPDEEKTHAGDIIVSATSTIGKTYVIKEGERFYFKDADVLLFRKRKPINGIFFTYGLTMPTMWSQIEPGLGATTVAHFLISKACKLLQPMPPMELQERFATFIKQSDKSKFEIKKSIEKIDELMKSLIANV